MKHGKAGGSVDERMRASTLLRGVCAGRYVARLRALLDQHRRQDEQQGRGALPTSAWPVVLLRLDQASGHFGAAGAQGRLAERAAKLAFALAAVLPAREGPAAA